MVDFRIWDPDLDPNSLHPKHTAFSGGVVNSLDELFDHKGMCRIALLKWRQDLQWYTRGLGMRV